MKKIWAWWRLELIIVLLVAGFFRLYNLSHVPPSPSLDEVSIGYNAYSLLKTGRDEYGALFPILLRAYDDWRPAMYVYAVMPMVGIFGLTAFAVRLPSVLLSLLTIVASYLLVSEIFYGHVPFAQKFKARLSLPCMTALLLAISPWHVYISRLGHEVNLGLSFFVFGGYLFLRSLHDKSYRTLLILSAFCFGISLAAYQSEKVVVPVFVFGLLCIFWKQLVQYKRALLVSLIVGMITILPTVSAALRPEGRTRFQATIAFSRDNPVYSDALEKFVAAKVRGDIIGQVFHHRYIASGQIFITNYFSHFSPAWLFWGGKDERHKVPDLGLMYSWEVWFVLAGIVRFVLSKEISVNKKVFTFLWLLVAPLPAAITTQAPHAMRAFTMLPMWQIFIALGMVTMLRASEKIPVVFQVVCMSFFVVVAGSATALFRQYFIEFPRTQSASFQYALSHVIPYVKEHEATYNSIVFSNETNLYQSYMFFLFYSRYDPKKYLSQGGTGSGGYAQTHTIGKYEFRPVHSSLDSRSRHVLILANPTDVPDGLSYISFHNLDGSLAVKGIIQK